MGAKKPAKRSKQAPTISLLVEVTPGFSREVRKWLSEAEFKRLRQEAAQFRELGSVIPGTGGLRKLRWGLENNKGKSGGARVIYFYDGDHIPIYLIAFYGKSGQGDLSPSEKKAAKKFVQAVKLEYQGKKPRLKVV